MNAREVMTKALSQYDGTRMPEFEAANICALLDKEGFTIMSKEDVDAVRAAMERSIVAIDDWLHQYASDMCSEDHVKATARRISENGGTLAYIADVQEKNRDAIRKLKSGGE